ncbi:hypothetical protein ACW73L_18765 [Methylolobus aquaticus]
MKRLRYPMALGCLAAAALWSVDTTPLADPLPPPKLNWQTVVNNNDPIPDAGGRTFNSYNQPSVNLRGTVVIRARSRGGPPLGPATHGIYMREMARRGGSIVKILDRNTVVPQPNNLGSLFAETPSFPRIDAYSNTIATRGNHQPVWRYLAADGSETRAGTTGIYTNPYGALITGAAKLGVVPDFGFFAVPGSPGMSFDVFPGSPSVTDRDTVVFKGNSPDGRTGIYFRKLRNEPIPLAEGAALAPAGGSSPVIAIATSRETLIPGTMTPFGSTAPPSAAGRLVVFAGFDNEEAPTLGGLFLAPVSPNPRLRSLIAVGAQGTPVVDEQGVPLAGQPRFARIGEAVSFDGRFVGFWGSWGTESATKTLQCPTEGNQCRIAYCRSFANDTTVNVPRNQGIFVLDTQARKNGLRLVARTGTESSPFDDFVYWNYSGAPPVEWCAANGIPTGGEGEGDSDDGEPPRWRSTAFVSASALGSGASVRTVFKATTLAGTTGIYLASNPGRAVITTLLDTSMPGRTLDPEAPEASIISELGLEREGLRGGWLAVSAKMSATGTVAAEEEDDDMAGVYITRLPGL